MDFLHVLFYTLTIEKMETLQIALDYFRDRMDWNKYQHQTKQTEAEALKKRRAFTEAVDEEREKNIDYYNENKQELAEKFHHLLNF